MPLTQPLPSTWTNQHVIANASNTNIAANSFLISNSGVKYGTTGNTYIPLKMPFATFYMTNQGTGTAVIVISRARDGVPLYGTAIQPITSTTGDQLRLITLPVDDPNGLTIQTTKTGTVSLSIVVSGVTDSGLLPLTEGSQAVMSSANKGGSPGVPGGGFTFVDPRGATSGRVGGGGGR